MILVPRTAQPAILAANEAVWIEALRVARRSKNRDDFKRQQRKYGHASIRTTLEKMFNGKCAYCESDIGAVSAAHIEHFRPKQRYLKLTYHWPNLLLSCPRCNDGAHKGTKFPKAAEGGPLIDPCVDDPSQHFDFVFDPLSGLALVKPLTPRGQTTAKVFGLNTRKALVQARTRLVKQLMALKPYELTDVAVAAVLAEARAQTSPYLAWTRRII